MAQRLHRFWMEVEGQDLIEYTLLMTFIVMAVFALIGAGHPAVVNIWTTGNNQLATANSAAS
jgi:Flp pilus assembly pilin Flp